MRRAEKKPQIKLTLCIGLGIASVAVSFMYRPQPQLITVTTECDSCQKIPSAEKVAVVLLPLKLHPKPSPESEPTLLYQAVLWFDEGEPNVDADSLQTKRVLRQLANITAHHPNATIQLDGHTDQRGSADENRKLSRARADDVATFLTRRLSIDPKRIRIMNAYGSAQPMEDKQNCSAYARNRRVELRVMSGEN